MVLMTICGRENQASSESEGGRSKSLNIWKRLSGNQISPHTNAILDSILLLKLKVRKNAANIETSHCKESKSLAKNF